MASPLATAPLGRVCTGAGLNGAPQLSQGCWSDQHRMLEWLAWDAGLASAMLE